MTRTIIALHVTPKSSRNEVVGWAADASGLPVLKVRIHATPEGGEANAALIKFLAKEWGVAPSQLELVSGSVSRHKRLNVGSEILFGKIQLLYPKR